MIWTILLGIGGLFGGSIVAGQIYAWVTDGFNPVWGILGNIIGFIPDILGVVWDVLWLTFDIFGD